MNKTQETTNLSNAEKMEFLKSIAFSLCAQHSKKYCLILLLDKSNNCIYPVYNLSARSMAEAANAVLVNNLPPPFEDMYDTGGKLCEIMQCSDYFILLIEEFSTLYGTQMLCNTNCSTEDWQKLMRKTIDFAYNVPNNSTIH